MNAADLIAFEADIAAEFNAGKIRAPVHLENGNEEQLIEIFKTIDRSDWVLGSWRQHLKCLLHGVPPEELKAEIMAGRSIALCFPKYRIVSSAIVGGILPIALGIAWEIKRDHERELKRTGYHHNDRRMMRPGPERMVHCFLGDMTAMTGIAHECMLYAAGHQLPIRFVIEDNGKSVCTDTAQTWGDYEHHSVDGLKYTYNLTWPHSGAGQRVQF